MLCGPDAQILHLPRASNDGPVVEFNGRFMSNEILSVTPADALIDEPRAIRVEGLSAGERITIASQTERAGGVIWRSQAEFDADAQGVVDLARQAPLAGSYQDVSAMGLLWSQVPAQDNCR